MNVPKYLPCCENCQHWHVRDNYACQHNGRWGGGGSDEGCTFQPKRWIPAIPATPAGAACAVPGTAQRRDVLHFAGEDGSGGPTRDVPVTITVEQGPDEEAPGEGVWFYVTVSADGIPIALEDHAASDGKLTLYVNSDVDDETLYAGLTIALHDPRGWQPQPVHQQIEDGGAGKPHNARPDTIIVQVFERRTFDRSYYAADPGCAYDLV